MMKKLIFLTSFILIFAFCVVGFCADVKGSLKVTTLQGAADVKFSGKNWQAAAVGMTLSQGDIIRTKQGSWVMLNIYGNKNNEIGSIELKQNSELKITRLLPDKGIIFDLALGEAMVRSEKLSVDNAKLEVKTPTSFIEVKGKATFSVTVEKLE